MFEIVKAGGPMMGPIILASIVAAAIILERLWTLQAKRVLPAELTDKVWRWVEQGQIQDKHIAALQQNSPLGKSSPPVSPIAIATARSSRRAIEDTGRHVVHELDRFIGTLGMIASLSPLMGLLGTVMGMIRTFNAITTAGIGNPTALAGGIAEALITTAAGSGRRDPGDDRLPVPARQGRAAGRGDGEGGDEAGAGDRAAARRPRPRGSQVGSRGAAA